MVHELEFSTTMILHLSIIKLHNQINNSILLGPQRGTEIRYENQIL